VTAVTYFNSHSPRLAFWRLGYRNRLKREIIARMNAHHGPVIQNEIPSLARVAAELECDVARKKYDLLDRSDVVSSPMLAAMMRHEAAKLEAKAEQLHLLASMHR
jgi:hypothetical protein